MKHLSLLLCVSALCIMSAAGSYNHGHPLLMNTKTHSPEPHKIHKRQDYSDQDRLCLPVIAAAGCENGLYQEYASLSQRCNASDDAQVLQDTCSRNSMGNYCGSIDIDPLETNIGRVCGISSTCSFECRNLLVSARNRLGCCVSAYNNSVSEFAYAYSLWSSCGIEPVTEKCSSSTIKLQPAQVDPTCTSDVFAERVQSLLCRKQYIEDVQDRLSATDGCQNYNDLIGDLCKVNRFGTYCTLLYNEIFKNLTAASSSCRDTSTCEPLCIETLNNITNTVGCCFNELYNTTTNGTTDYLWLSEKRWSRCGLTSAGFCEVKLTKPGNVIPTRRKIATI